ncbi:MAG: translation elongation factor Ts [Planctomycetota bacterium]|nr:translation elongation factor Ts [Planctomycetota bacterium]
MDISAKQVMELRQATGMPMMQCKKALIEADGDFEQAMDALRKQGLKTAEKRAGRATGEGLLAFRISDDGKTGTMVQVLCETEPVKNTPKFIEFVEKLADLAAAAGVNDAEGLGALDWGDGETAASTLKNLVGLIGENMQLGGVAHFQIDGDGSIGAYVHNDKKQGALSAVQGAGDDVASTAKELCQHIVFAKPKFLSRDQIPQEEVDKELAFLRDQVADDESMKGKPEQAVEGIIQGRLNKNFFGERVLSEQGWYRENAKKVKKVLEERGASVQDFKLFAPGA